MSGRPNEFPGWTLREAIQRSADPALLDACIQAEQTWRNAGFPTRFVRQIDLETGIAAMDKPMQERFRLRNAQLAKTRDVSNELRRHLGSGALMAWGRRGSPLADRQHIPQSAWGDLSFKSFKRSIVSERNSEKTPIFDVLIYPVVEAPDALDHLVGKPIVEAFQKYVFSDPEVMALSKRALSIGGKPHELGFQRRVLHAIWPVDFGPDSAWNSPIGILCDDHEFEATHAADLALSERFARLIAYLAAGELVAEGANRDGSIVVVPRPFWIRERTNLDLKNGDLVEYQPEVEDQEFSSPIFMGLSLKRPYQASAEFHVKPIEHDLAAGSRTEIAAVRQPNAVDTGLTRSPSDRLSPNEASIASAIESLWLNGIPAGISVKERDNRINEWQRANSVAVSSSKTISRYLKNRGRRQT